VDTFLSEFFVTFWRLAILFVLCIIILYLERIYDIINKNK